MKAPSMKTPSMKTLSRTMISPSRSPPRDFPGSQELIGGPCVEQRRHDRAPCARIGVGHRALDLCAGCPGECRAQQGGGPSDERRGRTRSARCHRRSAGRETRDRLSRRAQSLPANRGAEVRSIEWLSAVIAGRHGNHPAVPCNRGASDGALIAGRGRDDRPPASRVVQRFFQAALPVRRRLCNADAQVDDSHAGVDTLDDRIGGFLARRRWHAGGVRSGVEKHRPDEKRAARTDGWSFGATTRSQDASDESGVSGCDAAGSVCSRCRA